MSKLMNFPRPVSKQPSPPSGPAVAGIHLSGPNANKTALVVVSGDPRLGPLRIAKVYEKIGAFGSLFSDERLVEILTHGGPFASVFIDCPLTVPPCVACQRPLCPGVIQCEDVAVAYMLSISSRVRRRGARKGRPVNPQSQRVWDVMQLERGDGEIHEPTYSANQAPLVTRARTLQRRLNALSPAIALRETQVANALEAWRVPLALPAAVRSDYRRFECGLATRTLIARQMAAANLLAPVETSAEATAVCASVEVFHAFVAASVAALHAAGMTRQPPKEYRDIDGWVDLPHGR